jgi:hypothetical protein
MSIPRSTKRSSASRSESGYRTYLVTSVSAIGRQIGVDRKTVRAYIAKGLEPPAYKKRPPKEGIRIFEGGALVASHLPLEGRGEKRLDPAHRKSGSFSRRRPSSSEPATLTRAGDHTPRRSLDFYAAVGRRLAALGGLR